MKYDDTLHATTFYTYGTDIISIETNGVASYYIVDGQGSTRALTNAVGLITDTYTYDAVGNLTEQTGDTYNPYLYNQEQYDANTGLYYLRARYMNPSTGRFISMDAYSGSIYDPMSLHKYLYANGNPVMYSDPTGYTSLAEMATSTGIIGILTRAVVNGLCNVAFGRVIASIKSVQEDDYIQDTDDLLDALEDMREDFVDGAVTSVILDTVVSPAVKALAKTPVAQAVKNGVKNVAKNIATKVINSNAWKAACDFTRNSVKKLSNNESCIDSFKNLKIDFNKTKKLYRVMSNAEYDALVKNKEFTLYDMAMEEKWFASTQSDALKWGKIFYPDGNFKMIEITVSEEALTDMFFSSKLDNIGPAYCSPIEILNKFKDSIKEVI